VDEVDFVDGVDRDGQECKPQGRTCVFALFMVGKFCGMGGQAQGLPPTEEEKWAKKERPREPPHKSFNSYFLPVIIQHS